jgi:hypothetical protein
MYGVYDYIYRWVRGPQVFYFVTCDVAFSEVLYLNPLL